MKVKDVMSREVEVVNPNMSIRDAAEKMQALDVGPLPVCDGEKLVGMVTDRDITVRATAEGADPHSTRVREVMSEGAVWCFEDQDIEEAARMMQHKRIRRLPVLNRNKRLVGVVALGDMATGETSEWQSGKTLKEISR